MMRSHNDCGKGLRAKPEIPRSELNRLVIRHMRILKMNNPYNEIKWGVLVNGPCNALPAHSFEEAVTKANEINTALLAFQDTDLFKKDAEFLPVVWAQVGIWEQMSKGTHDPENTNWDEACA